MTVALIIINLVLLAALLAVGNYALRQRAERKQQGRFRPWPIPKVSIEAFDESFQTDDLGPTVDTEIRFIGRGMLDVPGGTSDTEAWVLAVLAKQARRMFEFGTCTGKTAYLWARNSPKEAEVITLTLPPDEAHRIAADAGDDPKAIKAAAEESVFTRFLYSGTGAEQKITQLYGDSKAFDETPYLDSCDLIFVDGSHAYSHVWSDSQKALRMLRPGGILLWHDYRGRQRAEGVFRALNEIARNRPLVHLAGTSLIAYRRPCGE
jgi:predicted O-methyltransferase YrrM